MKKILLADDHSIVRLGLRILLVEAFKQVMIDEADTEASILQLLKTQPYHLIILDVSIPGADFMGLLKYISTDLKTTSVLVFSMHTEELYGMHCLRMGAKGYVRKSSHEKEIIKAVEKILDGKRYISDAMAELIVASDNQQKKIDLLESLSFKELEIARFLCEGKALLEISDTLKIQYSTTCKYKQQIFEKLGIDSIAAMSRLMNR